jgi:hypothetical protein
MGTPRDHLFVLHVAALAVVLLTAGLSFASPPSSTEADKAGGAHAELRKQGNEAAKAGRIPEAIEAWTRAYEVRPVFAVACAIGRAELLGRANPGPAALWLTRCLRFAPIPVKGQAKELAAQQEELVLRDLARSKVGALRIDADPGAEIVVDGRAAGKAPLADEVFLEPGSHRITASLGSRSRSVEVAVAGGEARVVDLGLPAGPALKSNLLEEPPGLPARDGATTSKFPLRSVIAGASVAAGGIIAGVVLRGIADAEIASAEKTVNELEVSGDSHVMCMAAAAPPACREYGERHQKGEALGALSTVGFVVGGLAAAGTLAVVFLPRSSDGVALKADARGVRAVWSW